MGSGCEAVEETVDDLTKRGEKVGGLKVRLYRPFDVARFVATLPSSDCPICATTKGRSGAAARNGAKGSRAPADIAIGPFGEETVE